jgi:hypothetical protein
MRTGTIPKILAAAVVVAGLAGGRWATAQTTLQRLEQDIRGQAGQGAAAPGATIPPPPPAALGGPAHPRAYLGAWVDEQSDRGRGARVLQVRSGGPAERADLRPGDLIVAAAGTPVRQVSDLTAVIEKAAPGDKLVLEILRGPARLKPGLAPGEQSPPEVPQGGVPQKITVTLAAPPAGFSAEPQPEAVPPPAARRAPEPPAGPSLPAPLSTVPPPPLPGTTSPAARLSAGQPAETEISALKARVQDLERRVQELERALKEKEAKKPAP